MMAMDMNGRPYVTRETTQVERIVDPNYVHGFSIERRGGGRFFLSYSVRFPQPIAEAEQGLAPTGSFTEGGRVYTSAGELTWDIGQQVFLFSETDPIGLYELSIFVDGELYQKIDYDVSKSSF